MSGKPEGTSRCGYESLSLFSKRRVVEPSRPKRAKRARANSRRESRVGEAGGHQPVWVPVSLTLRCRPPTPIFVGSEVRGYDSPKLIVGSEVRGYDSPKLIVGSEVRGYDSPKLIVSE